MDNKIFKSVNINSFTPDINEFLRSTRVKFKDEYLVFFNNLAGEYKNISAAQEGQAIKQTIDLINEVIADISSILLSEDTKKNKEMIKGTINKINLVNKQFEFFAQGADLSKSLRDKIADVEKKTGVNVKHMKKTSEIIKGKLGKMKLGGWQLPSMVKGFGKDLGNSLMESLLGPYAGIGQLVTKSVGSMLSRKQAKSDAVLNEAMISMTDKLNPSLTGMYSTVQGSGKSEMGGILGRGYAKGMEQASLAGLTAFFSGPALKTKYTAELLDAVKKGRKVGDGSNKDSAKGFSFNPLEWMGLGKVWEWIRKFPVGKLASIGGILAKIAGIGSVVWDSFFSQKVAEEKGWFGAKKGKDLPMGQGIAAAFGNVFGGKFGIGKGTIGEVASGAVGGAIKGALIGSFAGPLGIPIGAAIGAGTHLIGGERIANAMQTVSRFATLHDTKTDEFKAPIYAREIADATKEGFKDLANTFKGVMDEVKKTYISPFSTPAGSSSGKKAYDSKDTLLSYLNLGGFDLA